MIDRTYLDRYEMAVVGSKNERSNRQNWYLGEEVEAVKILYTKDRICNLMVQELDDEDDMLNEDQDTLLDEIEQDLREKPDKDILGPVYPNKD